MGGVEQAQQVICGAGIYGVKLCAVPHIGGVVQVADPSLGQVQAILTLPFLVLAICHGFRDKGAATAAQGN